MLSDYEMAVQKHKYIVEPGGEPQINITAISGLLDLGKSGGMAGAAAKLTKEGRDYRAEWKESAERGSLIHGYCEAFLRGESIEMHEDLHGYVDALEKFILDKNPLNFLDPEFVVVNPLDGYGGRGDMLVTFDDQLTLCDLKSGKEYAVEHTLQLAAQRYASRAIYNTDGALVDAVPMPEIDRAGCLYVHEDGSYEFKEYPAGKLAFSAFLSLLEAYRWANSDTIKQLTKESRKK